MNDDPRDIGVQDDIRIDLSQPHEVTYWTYRLNVSEDELRKAIETAGELAIDVESYVRGRQGTGTRENR